MLLLAIGAAALARSPPCAVALCLHGAVAPLLDGGTPSLLELGGRREHIMSFLHPVH
jgi:hypothetical protein